MKAFILGKTWAWKNQTGTNFMEKLGTVANRDLAGVIDLGDGFQ